MAVSSDVALLLPVAVEVQLSCFVGLILETYSGHVGIIPGDSAVG